MILALQYLDARPNLADFPVDEVAGRLRTALELLPVTHVLIGWNIPPRFRDACKDEAVQAKVKFLRWQPLLTGDGSLALQSDWRTVSLSGERMRGYRDLDEFTFACPNHPAAREAILDHLSLLLETGIYDGAFLDRIRFPSPAKDPRTELGCFCGACREAAAAKDFDLLDAQHRISGLAQTHAGMMALVRGLLRAVPGTLDEVSRRALDGFLRFRETTITGFVGAAAKRVRAASLEVGLDCFSPCLMRSVGQDLRALGEFADWIKVMSYGHAQGPAGLPFELTGFTNCLVQAAGQSESSALAILEQETGMGIPRSLDTLTRIGLASEEIGREVTRGVQAATGALLAGIEAVDIPGVCETSSLRLHQDLQAVLAARPAGLALSWDLMDIPERNLHAIRQSLFS
jgi:hypothetical protein